MDDYDPTNLGLNYIGDLGGSLTQSFDFVVPDGQQLLIVASSTFGPLDCDYSFSIENFPCTEIDRFQVPTMSEYGLIALGVLMLAAIVFVLRRRTRLTA